MTKTIKVVGGVYVVGQGVRVQLTPDQHKARAPRLELVEGADGLYTAKEPMQFKIGEQFGVDTVDKGQAHLIDIIESIEPAEPVDDHADGLIQDRHDNEGGFNTPRRGAAKKR